MKRLITLPVLPCALLLTLLCSACSTPPAMTGTSRWGDAEPVTPGLHTITITPDTHYVNVVGGDVIRFVDGDKSFAWAFDGALCSYQFDLAKAAPQGVLDHSVIAYVDPDPYYCGR